MLFFPVRIVLLPCSICDLSSFLLFGRPEQSVACADSHGAYGLKYVSMKEQNQQK